MEENKRSKPVTILTGFLGAGKTTFLNSLLQATPRKRYAIIENEIGKEGIDSELLVSITDELVQLDHGCLCCTMNNDLYVALEQIIDRRDDFDELVIECTGVANPAPVAEPFLTHPLIRAFFPLKRVICLVDAELIEDQLREQDEAVQQIAFSDVILINKTDLVSASYVDGLKKRLMKMNPFSTVSIGCKGASYPLAEIEMVDHRSQPVSFNLSVTAGKGLAGPITGRKQFKHGDIVSLSFCYSEVFETQQLYHRMLQFMMIQSASIFRMKGVFYDPGNERKVILQSVGNRLGMEEGRLWQAGEEKHSRVVFIGKGLNPDSFEKMLNQCLRAKGKIVS